MPKATAAIIVVLAALAIVHTWTIFSQTIDEPAHISAGVQLLDQGRYTIDQQHPPLARAFIGIGPILRGAHYRELPHWLHAGNAILYGTGDYLATLASARAGTLVFFLLGCFVVFAWAERLSAGVAALVFFALQPTVLAHAGVATTDMAAAATIAAALFAFTSWLDRPTHGRAAILGIAILAALTAKFSSVVFLPSAFVAILLVRRSKLRASLWIAFAISLAVLFVPGFVEGVNELRAHNRGGHPAYLFGEVRRDGWWYYFPIALWFKSTLPLLIAFALGVRKRTADLVAAIVAILLVAMASRISIGVRHVLPLYPLLAIVAGYGVMQLRRSFAIPLIAAQVLSFALAHPDHLAYFNVTAGGDPSRILLDSNLDWGQDLLRLEDACARHRIETLHIALFTSANPRRHALPQVVPLRPFTPAHGWIAISEMQRKDVGARGRLRGGYDWLLRHEPVERIGKSILLYHVP
jgi:hypothetical protein